MIKAKLASRKGGQCLLWAEARDIIHPAGVRGMESSASLGWEGETPSAEAQPFS